jgi:hypothetical protein
MLQAPTFESPNLTPVVSRDDYQEKLVPPHSPFYQHPPASHERIPGNLQITPSKMKSQTLGVYEKDLESGPATPLSTNNELNPFTSKVSIGANQECTMWPSRKTLEQNRLAERKQKHGRRALGFANLRHWWATASPKQKWLLRGLLAFFVIGAIVAIAVGVTNAVHGGVYSGNGQSRQIGDEGN